MTTPSPIQRSELIQAVVAALKAEAVTWPRLIHIGRAIAVRLATLLGPPAELVEDHRRAVAALFLAKPTATPAEQSIARVQFRAATLLLELCAGHAVDAFAHCLGEAANLPDGAPVLTVLSRFLDDAGIERRFGGAEARGLGAECLNFPPGRTSLLIAAMAFLGLSSRSTANDRQTAFEQIVLPQMRRAATRDDANLLLALEAATYVNYIKATETPEHHIQAFAAIEAAYEALPRRPAKASLPTTSDAPRVVFLIPNGTVLAHSEVLLAFLDGLRKLPLAPIDPFVLIYFAPDGGDLGRRLDQLGVPWAVGGQMHGYEFVRQFEAVEDKVAALGADSVVFVSLPQHLPYFMRRPLAPIQIWWSMKFALPNFAELDGRVFYRSLFDRKIEIAGRTWRGGPLAFTPPPPPNPAAVAAIRARFPGKTILGTIAREEKIANDDYLLAVVDILQRRPDTVFLWTGRTQLRHVTDAFVAGGVADRCHFIGWVEPTAHIAAFDLFLETYPLTGLMSGWTMALGKPIVSVGSLGWLATYLEPIFDGSIPASPDDLRQIEEIFRPVRAELPTLWAPHPRDMGPFVDKLLDDPQLAVRFGAVLRRYAETFMSDEAASAAIQARHFAAIIHEARARS
jgi:hypothetical protein